MERKAINDPPILLPLQGEGSVTHALQQMTLEQPFRRWVSLWDMGFTFSLARKGRARHGDVDMPLQEIVQSYIRGHGPITGSLLLPTGGVSQCWRGLNPARPAWKGQGRPTMCQVVPPDDLTDPEIIGNHEALLQYHVQRFRKAYFVTTSTTREAPKVIRRCPGRSGINVITHSYLDGTPGRLRGDLVLVCAQSRQYEDTLGDCKGYTYQGVTLVEDELGGWEMDAMRWHQLISTGYVQDSSQLRGFVTEMQSAEKRGYRTLNWTMMHHLTTHLGLTHSVGEPLLGSYPGLTPLFYALPEEEATEAFNGWLLLDALPQHKAEVWIHRLIDMGGGIVASTMPLNIMKEVGKLLKEESLWYGSALVTSNLKRVKGWWKNCDTKTAAGRQHIHI
eukprot:3830159-Rhodomonas_salina.3